jgi:glycosyltransferase involved in cell wall biosynthesis
MILGEASDGALRSLYGQGATEGDLLFLEQLSHGFSPIDLLRPSVAARIAAFLSVFTDSFHGGKSVCDDGPAFSGRGTAVLGLNHRSALLMWAFHRLGFFRFHGDHFRNLASFRFFSLAVGKGGEYLFPLFPIPISAVSPSQAAWIRQRGGRVDAVIGNGIINSSEIAPLIRERQRLRKSLRREMGWGENAFVACCLSSHFPVKGTMRIPEVAAGCPGLHIIAAGSGPLSNQVNGRADELGLGSRYRMIPATEQRLEILAGADIFLHLPHDETFCIAVTEAMALGVVPVVSPVGALPGMIQPGVNGYLTEGNPIDSAVKRISGLMTHEGRNRLKQMAHAASSMAVNRFRDSYTIFRYLQAMGFYS